jgi:putative ABC transport system permease protein
MWGRAWLRQFIQDSGYGLRAMRRSPGFAAVAVFTLALGIDANTAIFSVVNAVLLRPLPYREPARLVTVLHEGWKPVAPTIFLDWREQSRSFEAIAAAQLWSLNVRGRDRPEQLTVLQTGAEMLQVLGVDAALGRTYAAGEDRPGHERVVVLGHRLWQRRFGGDRNAVGQQVLLDGEPYTVIGVMTPDFQFAPFRATHATGGGRDYGKQQRDGCGSQRVGRRHSLEQARQQSRHPTLPPRPTSRRRSGAPVRAPPAVPGTG